MEYLSESLEDTQKIAAAVAHGLKGGEFISLIGDLGAGKTTFTRGLVAALGGTVRVKSPTFTVMNEYPVNSGSIKRVVHIDFYRFSEMGELSALSLEDERRPDTVILAEWPDALKEADWQPDMTVQIEHQTENKRRLFIHKTK